MAATGSTLATRSTGASAPWPSCSADANSTSCYPTTAAALTSMARSIGPMPLQARAAIAFSPSCGPYAVTPGSYLPVAPLLILVGALDQRTAAAPCLELANWTPKVVVRVLGESGDAIE